MPWIGAILLVVGFVAIVQRLEVVGRSKAVIEAAHEALAVLRDASSNELQKEQALQRQAVRLFGLFLYLTAAAGAALLLPAAVVWGIGQLGWLDWHDVVATAVSAEFLTATTVVAIVVAIARRGFSRDV